MSYQSKSTFQTATDGSFTSGSNKWTGQEVEDALINMSDSVAWIDQVYTATPGAYNCANGTLQVMTLTSNLNLSITNPVAGQYYTLIKKGAYTLGLPTSEYSASGLTTGTATTIINFLYDGTDYYFTFASYSGT
jgi:hypothetical protein